MRPNEFAKCVDQIIYLMSSPTISISTCVLSQFVIIVVICNSCRNL